MLRTENLSDEDIVALQSHVDMVFDVWGRYGNNVSMTWSETAGLYQAKNLLIDASRRYEVGTPLREDIVSKLDESLCSVPRHALDINVDSESYQSFIEAARHLNPQEAARNLKIEASSDDSPFSAEEVRSFIQVSIPPTGIIAVERVVFDKLSQEYESGEVRGEYTPPGHPEEGATIRFSNEALRKYYKAQKEDFIEGGHQQDDAQEKARDMVLRSVTHEFAHAFSQILPTAPLKRWDEFASQEPVAVSEYVSKYYKKDHPAKYQEDFAESMTLYVHDPEHLKALSPARFKGMEEIFKELAYRDD